jgi:hypothetical protein
MSTTRPGARIKARTPEEFERWRRLAEKRLRQSNNDTPTPTNVTTTEVKK